MLTSFCNRISKSSVLGFAAATLIANSLVASAVRADALGTWIQNESNRSAQMITQAISRGDTARGAVIASPSRGNPNYYHHWIRDAAIVMDVVAQLYMRSNSQQQKSTYSRLMWEYIDFSRKNQRTPNPSGAPDDLGLGEPKFAVSGAAEPEPWGRPQNDGPALRAIAICHWAQLLIGEGRKKEVLDRLYNIGGAPTTVLRADLDFSAKYWGNSSVDLWEEVKGQHFFTRIVIRRALLEGAKLAQALGDTEKQQWYRGQAMALERAISSHWDGRSLIRATLQVEGDNRGKNSNLDAGVIVGALRGDMHDGFFAPSDDRVLSTAARIVADYNNRYQVIRDHKFDSEGGALGAAIGRYPEDVWTGNGTAKDGGNPWFLLTLSYSELCYRVAQDWKRNGKINIGPGAQAFLSTVIGSSVQTRAGETIGSGDPRFNQLITDAQNGGLSFIRRVRFHAAPDGGMPEQFNRTTGFVQGAQDLTWSYASFLSVMFAR